MANRLLRMTGNTQKPPGILLTEGARGLSYQMIVVSAGVWLSNTTGFPSCRA